MTETLQKKTIIYYVLGSAFFMTLIVLYLIFGRSLEAFCFPEESAETMILKYAVNITRDPLPEGIDALIYMDDPSMEGMEIVTEGTLTELVIANIHTIADGNKMHIAMSEELPDEVYESVTVAAGEGTQLMLRLTTEEAVVCKAVLLEDGVGIAMRGYSEYEELVVLAYADEYGQMLAEETAALSSTDDRVGILAVKSNLVSLNDEGLPYIKEMNLTCDALVILSAGHDEDAQASASQMYVAGEAVQSVGSSRSGVVIHYCADYYDPVRDSAYLAAALEECLAAYLGGEDNALLPAERSSNPMISRASCPAVRVYLFFEENENDREIFMQERFIEELAVRLKEALLAWPEN